MTENLDSLPTIHLPIDYTEGWKSPTIFVILTETPNGGQRRQLRASRQGALAAAEKAKARGLKAEILLAQLNYWGRLDV